MCKLSLALVQEIDCDGQKRNMMNNNFEQYNEENEWWADAYTYFDLMSRNGGIFVQENVIISRNTDLQNMFGKK